MKIGKFRTWYVILFLIISMPWPAFVSVAQETTRRLGFIQGKTMRMSKKGVVVSGLKIAVFAGRLRGESNAPISVEKAKRLPSYERDIQSDDWGNFFAPLYEGEYTLIPYSDDGRLLFPYRPNPSGFFPTVKVLPEKVIKVTIIRP